MKTFSTRERARGFTLIEMMCAVTVAGILSSIAYPAYTNVVHKARRADALVALLSVQMAQERYRADHAQYGSLADLRMAATSPSRHYRLAIASSDSSGYELRAEATGTQSGDKACRHLKLLVDGMNVTQASGPDGRFTNSEAVNRKCWGM